MSSLILSPLRLLQRGLGWSWVVLVVQRDDDGVAVYKLPNDPPVSVRLNTDDTVSVTIGHGDEGEALLADLRSLVVIGAGWTPRRSQDAGTGETVVRT